MTAFNAVRFRVKPGRDQEFLDAHKKVEANWPGLIHANIIKTGDRAYCIIAEWADMDACHAELVAKGVPILREPTDLPDWRHRTLFFRDPEGNIIEIYAEY